MFNLLQAVAEAPVKPEPSALQQYQPFIMIGLMVLVLWLFMWRPEAKRRKEMQKFRDSLTKGSKVVSAGGIHGVVKEVNDVTLVIEIDNNVHITIDKSMVVAAPVQK